MSFKILCKMKVDLSYLQEMSGGNQDLVLEMINIFRIQVEEFTNEMEGYLNGKDYKSLGQLAHKAKSSISIMGLNDLSDVLKSLENLAKEGKQTKKYPELIDRFKLGTKEAIKELDEVLQNLELYF